MDEEAEKAKALEGAGAMAGELPAPLEPIFPTEAVEQSVKTWASSRHGCTRLSSGHTIHIGLVDLKCLHTGFALKCH